MCYFQNYNQKTTNYGRNRTINSRKNQNARNKKETYIYLRILEVNTIKQAEMKEKHLKISQENEKLLETKLQYRNLIKEINAWAVPLVRYSGSFLK